MIRKYYMYMSQRMNAVKRPFKILHGPHNMNSLETLHYALSLHFSNDCPIITNLVDPLAVGGI